MVQTALTSLALGYRPLWNAARKLVGVQLFMHEGGDDQPDVPHFLRMLQEMAAPTAPRLILSPQSRHLLGLLLQHTVRDAQQLIEVRGEWLADSALYDLVQRAQARGVRLVWRGAINDLPDADSARWFASSMLRLAPQDAIQLMQLSPGAPAPEHLELLDGQIYEELHSRAIMHRCLDQQLGQCHGHVVAREHLFVLVHLRAGQHGTNGEQRHGRCGIGQHGHGLVHRPRPRCTPAGRRRTRRTAL